MNIHLRRTDLFDLQAETAGPYTECAPIYDHMMKDVDYKRWAKYLIQLMKIADLDIKSSGLRSMQLCELGTGTGNIAIQLSRYGFQVTGVDSSDQMLAIARTKYARKSKLGLEFIHNNMVDYRPNVQYDVMICVYDSINYISPYETLELFFNNAFLNLKRRGLFIFDASLEPNSLNDPTVFRQHGKIDGISYQRESSYNPGIKTHTTRLRIKKGDRIFEEVHSEYVYTLEKLKHAACGAGFKEVLTAGDFTLLEATDQSERVHFVMTKL